MHYRMLILAISMFFGAPLAADLTTIPYLNKKMAPITIQEGVTLAIPHEILKNWKMAYSLVTRDGSIFEWIPKNEEIENWSELIQIQSFVLNQRQSAENFAVNFFKTLKQNYPQVKTNVLQHSNESVLLEWSLPQPAGDQVPQNELALILSTDKGVYRIAYTKKVTALAPNERDEWLKRLKTAKIVQREFPPSMLMAPQKK